MKNSVEDFDVFFLFSLLLLLFTSIKAIILFKRSINLIDIMIMTIKRNNIFHQHVFFTLNLNILNDLINVIKRKKKKNLNIQSE